MPPAGRAGAVVALLLAGAGVLVIVLMPRG